MALQNPINVPIRVDAIWSNGENIAPPTADFSLLSKTLTQTSPWLGDTVRRAANDPYPLPKGLHIHWTLPKALTRGTTVYVLDHSVFNELIQQGVPCSLMQTLQAKAQSSLAELTLDQLNTLLSDLVPASSFVPLSSAAFQPLSSLGTYTNLVSSDDTVSVYSYAASLSWDPVFLQIYGPIIVHTAARMKLPPVPNRWLVVRADDSGSQQAWVVESDRLTLPNAKGTAPSGVGPTAIPGQFSGTPHPAVSLATAFQFIGMASSAATWAESPSAARFAPLTAVGHGVPEFSAFYPNCQGVFGFCDSSATESTPYSYTVIGWFSEATNDPASSSYAVSPWSAVSDVATRVKNLSWNVAANPAWASIDGSLYSAKISVTGSNSGVIATDLKGIEVAIGNTAGEALSALLAKENKSPVLGLDPETLLDAAQAGVLRQALDADGSAVIENALHQQAFQAEAGGWIWDIAPIPLPSDQVGLSPKMAAATPQLTDDLATKLNALNVAQIQFDRTQTYLKSQRRLLFADWCRSLHLETDEATHYSDSLGGLPGLAVTAVNAMATAVDAAGMGDASQSNMIAYLAAKALYLAHSAIGAALQAMPSGSTFGLKRKPAPRFWRPNDPVVLLSDTGTLPSPLQAAPASPLSYDAANLLICTSTSPGSTAPPYLNPTWTGPAAACIAALVETLPAVTCTQSWRPLLLQWEAQFYPFLGTRTISTASPVTVTPYDSTFISANFSPDPAGIELAANSGVSTASDAATYNGRVVLSSHAARTMRDRILRLAGLETTKPPAALEAASLPGLLGTDAAAKGLLTSAYASNSITLSQALDGFHDRLLMLRRIPQISIFDPNWNNSGSPAKAQDATWDPDSQSFYNEIGTQATASPQQNDIYNPIRAGKCELTYLWLVDAFGQTRKWSLGTGNLISARTLPNVTAPVQDAAPAFFLPPRLAQSSRLLFRWIAADGSGAVESNRHPVTTPVCGWLALNRVDETSLVFEADGTLLGWVPAAGGPLVTAPGRAPAPIADPFLSQVVAQMQTPTSFFDHIGNALLTIEPRAHRQHTARSVLVSRPLALVRAALRLELLGAPSPDQHYEWLEKASLTTTDSYCPVSSTDIPGPVSPFLQRQTGGFTQVAFPVRLGDVSMDDDGLVAYWGPLTVSGSSATLPFQPTWVDSAPEEQNGAAPILSLTCDPASPPTQVLLLLDPRAPIHATSGILPTKEISIPPDMYAAAVRNMELLLTVGPLLTSPHQILMPLPTEVPGTWSWIEGQGGNSAAPLALSGKIDDRAHLMHEPPVIREGWLQVTNVEGGD